MIVNYYPNFSLLNGDTMQMLPQLTQQVDMIFADPPYFISGGGKTIRGNRVITTNFGDWDKKRTEKENNMDLILNMLRIMQFYISTIPKKLNLPNPQI